MGWSSSSGWNNSGWSAAAPAVIGSSHLYWRMTFDNTVDGSDNLIDLAEAEWLVGGVDQATGGTATASSQYNPDVIYFASQAFDDDTGTRWICNFELPCWLQYQFASPILPTEFSITPFLAGRAPENVLVEFSDDGASFTTFTTINTGALSDWANGTKRTFSIP